MILVSCFWDNLLRYLNAYAKELAKDLYQPLSCNLSGKCGVIQVIQCWYATFHIWKPFWSAGMCWHFQENSGVTLFWNFVNNPRFFCVIKYCLVRKHTVNIFIKMCLYIWDLKFTDQASGSSGISGWTHNPKTLSIVHIHYIQ